MKAAQKEMLAATHAQPEQIIKKACQLPAAKPAAAPEADDMEVSGETLSSESEALLTDR